MRKLTLPFKTRRHLALAAIVVVAAGLPFLWYHRPQPADSRQRAAALIEMSTYNELLADGRPVLHFDFDTTYVRAAWVNHVTALPSCFGLLIADDTWRPAAPHLSPDSVRSLVTQRLDSLNQRLDNMRDVSDELQYYLRVHGVQDEGYAMVYSFARRVSASVDSLNREVKALQALGPKQKLTLARRERYRVHYTDDSLCIHVLSCHPAKHAGHHSRLFQTDSSKTPDGITVLRRKRFFPTIEPSTFVARYGALGQRALSHDTLFTALPGPRPNSDDHGLLRRMGHGLVSGIWRADTLAGGTRIDSTGIYMGEMDRFGRASGHGKLFSRNKFYYEGFWKNNMRSGFGFQVSFHRKMRAGEWQHDVYRGERVKYNANRIYGIDISKYQHGKGRRHYPIDWKRVRISHLGNISRKHVSGQVDYPVSFCYIKSTEGITHFNPYYYADYRAARAAGIHVGSYHFFSIRSKASLQAKFFLKKSNFKKGDFPPVLDLEPLPSQVKKIGGVHELWNRVRLWLRLVEQGTGTKPILYVSQQFVNQWLPAAPDIKRDYQVWIARYGEYKPDIRLAIWQLAPDGRVNGIHGTVDINVFNGYRSTFQDFLDHHRVR